MATAAATARTAARILMAPLRLRGDSGVPDGVIRTSIGIAVDVQPHSTDPVSGEQPGPAPEGAKKAYLVLAYLVLSERQ